MEGLRFTSGGEGRHDLRGRAVLLTLLPVVVLGVLYFLFVEYVLQNLNLPAHEQRLTLQVGGIVLAVLAAILGAACGYLLAEHLTRPIRLLLRLAETGDVAAARMASLKNQGPEVAELYRRVTILVHQNQTGAQALEELEQLRSTLDSFREEIARTGQHGVPPSTSRRFEGPLGEIAHGLESKRAQLLEFFRDLRARLAHVHTDVAALAETLRLEEEPFERGRGGMAEVAIFADEGAHLSASRGLLTRVRRMGTVLALEAVRVSGPQARLEDLFDRFHAGLNELDRSLDPFLPADGWRGNGDEGNGSDGPDTPASAERPAQEAAQKDEEGLGQRCQHILDTLDSLERRLSEVEER